MRRSAVMPVAEASQEVTLIVDVGGFEGPLDLLLELARHHKIDLKQISILALAEQYLVFIEKARQAAARTCSRLSGDGGMAGLSQVAHAHSVPHRAATRQSPQDLAARLAFRLQRLQAMRDAAARLMARNLLGRDVFARGAPEPLVIDTRREYGDNLIDLLKAYAERRQKKMARQAIRFEALPTWSIKEARAALERLVGAMDDWAPFDSWLWTI